VTGVIATPSCALPQAQVDVTGGGAFTVTVHLIVPECPVLSVIVTVKLNVPLTVAVPEMVPDEEIVRPAGKPEAVKVYGPPEPPLPVSVTGVIAWPSVTVSQPQLDVTGGTTVTEQCSVPVCPAASVMVTV
jgi:hypothetical protein